MGTYTPKIKRYNGVGWDEIKFNEMKADTDNRTVATIPNDYNSKFKISGLKQSSYIGLPSAAGYYSTVWGIRGWSDSSGGQAHEFAFSQDGGLYHRTGSTTTWGDWGKFAYANKNNGFIGPQTFNGNGNGAPITIRYSIDDDYGMNINVENGDGDEWVYNVDFPGGAGDEYGIQFPEKSGTLAVTSDISNATISFTQGGVSKGSFTLNQSGNATIALDAGGGSSVHLYRHVFHIGGGGNPEFSVTFYDATSGSLTWAQFVSSVGYKGVCGGADLDGEALTPWLMQKSGSSNVVVYYNNMNGVWSSKTASSFSALWSTTQETTQIF